MENLIVLILVLFVLGYAFAPLFNQELHANSLRVFIVLYVTLFGLATLFSPARNDEGILVGDLFASLGLTFFWSMRKKSDPSLLQPHSPLTPESPTPESQSLPAPHHPHEAPPSSPLGSR
jgi:hypothetical protein